MLAFLFSACEKEDPLANFPKISNLEVFPDTVVEFADTVLITFDYVDGNGDLGNFDPNINSLSVKDSRLENADWYHIQPLSPIGSNVSIQGKLTVKLNNLFLIGNSNMEALTLKVQITDREGHESDELISGEIIVVR